MGLMMTMSCDREKEKLQTRRVQNKERDETHKRRRDNERTITYMEDNDTNVHNAHEHVTKARQSK